MNRRLSVKIHIVVLLTAAILAGLIWLLLRPQNHADAADMSQTAQPVISAVTSPEPSASPLPSASAETEQKSRNSDDSLLRIVNRQNPVSSSYVPDDLVDFSGSANGVQQLRSEAAAALLKMFDAAEQDGIHLCLISGYRSYAEQVSLYNTYVNQYGADYADSIDDRPGECEHQLGLMADLGTDDHACDFEDCFHDSTAYEWLKSHGAEYGWIERYPTGKEDVTGIAASSWNWRYVGVDEAEKIRDSGLTMEEYEEQNSPF